MPASSCAATHNRHSRRQGLICGSCCRSLSFGPNWTDIRVDKSSKKCAKSSTEGIAAGTIGRWISTSASTGTPMVGTDWCWPMPSWVPAFWPVLSEAAIRGPVPRLAAVYPPDAPDRRSGRLARGVDARRSTAPAFGRSARCAPDARPVHRCGLCWGGLY